jgi:hypothetical protein
VSHGETYLKAITNISTKYYGWLYFLKRAKDIKLGIPYFGHYIQKRR